MAMRGAWGLEAGEAWVQWRGVSRGVLLAQFALVDGGGIRGRRSLPEGPVVVVPSPSRCSE